MARRTIRARRASPYLLYLVIALAILTVACAIGWAWSYSKMNQEEINAFGADQIERAVSGVDLYQEEFKKYPGAGNTLTAIIANRDKLATEYRSDIVQLGKALAGEQLGAKEGTELRTAVSGLVDGTSTMLAQVSKTLQDSYKVGAEQGPAIEVNPQNAKEAARSLLQRLDALVALARQNTTAIGNLQTQNKGVQEQLDAAKAEYARQLAQVNQNSADEKKSLTEARDRALAQTKQFEEEKQRVLDQQVAKQRQFDADRQKLDRQVLTLQNNLKDLSAEVAKFRRVPTETGIDGRVVSVAEQGAIAYGDLGKKDGVLLGMPFSIFSRTELGKPKPEPKAQCRIVRVMADACELRIQQLQADNPVVPGDILYNPVYDRERRLRFVLVGRMDINGNGSDDAEQLKAMIQQFGGRVDSTLTVQTDFLVVGEEPVLPSPPAAGASPMERQMFDEARKRFIEYTDAKARAENFSIPVLSLNRFMGLVGLAGQT